MRKRRPRTGGHDGLERMPLAAAQPERRLQARCDVEFAIADANGRQDRRQRLAGQQAGGPDRLDLAGVLHLAQRFHRVDQRQDLRRGTFR